MLMTVATLTMLRKCLVSQLWAKHMEPSSAFLDSGLVNFSQYGLDALTPGVFDDNPTSINLFFGSGWVRGWIYVGGLRANSWHDGERQTTQRRTKSNRKKAVDCADESVFSAARCIPTPHRICCRLGSAVLGSRKGPAIGIAIGLSPRPYLPQRTVGSIPHVSVLPLFRGNFCLLCNNCTTPFMVLSHHPPFHELRNSYLLSWNKSTYTCTTQLNPTKHRNHEKVT